MTDRVWACTGQRNSELTRGFWTHVQGEERPPGFSMGEEADTFRRNERGEPLPASRFPQRLYVRRPVRTKKSVLPYAHSGHHFLSGEAAAIVAAHDLGQGALHRATLFDNDKTTVLSEDLHLLAIGNAKRTIWIERSPDLERIYPDEEFYRLPYEATRTAVLARPEALEGPDLWADPQVRGGFFLSDRLGQALVVAKLKRALRLRPVPVAG